MWEFPALRILICFIAVSFSTEDSNASRLAQTQTSGVGSLKERLRKVIVRQVSRIEVVIIFVCSLVIGFTFVSTRESIGGFIQKVKFNLLVFLKFIEDCINLLDFMGKFNENYS